jgi:hypothetical protein
MRSHFKEEVYQDILSQHLGGSHCVLKPFGITDITTDKLHAELKEWCSWKAALGQLLSYNYASKRPQLRVYFFGKKPSKNNLHAIVTCLRSYNVNAYHVDILENYIMQIEDLHIGEIEHVIPKCLPKKEQVHNIEGMYEEIRSALLSTNKINLDDISRWTGVQKFLLMRTLRDVYKKDIDYTVKNAQHPNCVKYANHYKEVFVTKNCLLKLCMMSKFQNANKLRDLVTDLIQKQS